MKSRVVGLYQPYPHTFGGVQAMVIKMAHRLPERGYEPLVICPEAGRFTGLLQEQGLPFLVSDPGSSWHVYGRGGRGLSYLLSPQRALALVRYWWQLARKLRQHQVALLHCNDYRAVMLAAPAARWARIPVLWHMHGFIQSSAANFLAARLANGIVPVSHGMLDYLNLPSWLFGKCQVIHNGVDASTPLPAALLKDSAKAPIVLAVGTLHPRKGYETLIEAFTRVKPHCPSAECWIVGPDFGDGAYTRFLEERIERMGLQGKVRLLGARPDVQALLGQCRVMCVPSWIEPFGLVALEAMLASKPVVASRTGGLPEIVREGETGRLVETKNAAATAEALLAMLRDPGQAEEFGRAGRARALEEFGMSRMMNSLAETYGRLLAPPARQGRASHGPNAVIDNGRGPNWATKFE